MSEHDDALLLLIELANRYVDKVSDVRRTRAGIARPYPTPRRCAFVDGAEAMSGLVRCPLCGASEGYYLIDGSRWWKVACDACGQVIAEAPSTRDWKPPPKQCDSADAAWNAAGAHAQSLRDEIASVYAAIASVGARYLDPPDGGEVPIGEQVRRLAADAQSLRDRVAALEAALRGLVGVKDMRLRLIKLHEMGHGTDYTDYYRLKSLAWAAARAALEQKP